MTRIQANVQHVSIFRVGNIYTIGVLYDFESNNQINDLGIIIQGDNISFSIGESDGHKNPGTATTSTTFHIIDESGYTPAFNVDKGSGTVITVPVFSLKQQDQLKVAGEIISVLSATRPTLSVFPRTTPDLPPDIVLETGVDGADAASRDWGWRGW